MKTVIDVLKKEARDLEINMGCLQREIDYKEEELASQKERLSYYKQRLEDIESHIKGIEEKENRPIDIQAERIKAKGFKGEHHCCCKN